MAMTARYDDHYQDDDIRYGASPGVLMRAVHWMNDGLEWLLENGGELVIDTRVNLDRFWLNDRLKPQFDEYASNMGLYSNRLEPVEWEMKDLNKFRSELLEKRKEHQKQIKAHEKKIKNFGSGQEVAHLSAEDHRQIQALTKKIDGHDTEVTDLNESLKVLSMVKSLRNFQKFMRAPFIAKPFVFAHQHLAGTALSGSIAALAGAGFIASGAHVDFDMQNGVRLVSAPASASIQVDSGPIVSVQSQVEQTKLTAAEIDNAIDTINSINRSAERNMASDSYGAFMAVSDGTNIADQNRELLFGNGPMSREPIESMATSVATAAYMESRFDLRAQSSTNCVGLLQSNKTYLTILLAHQDILARIKGADGATILDGFNADMRNAVPDFDALLEATRNPKTGEVNRFALNPIMEERLEKMDGRNRERLESMLTGRSGATLQVIAHLIVRNQTKVDPWVVQNFGPDVAYHLPHVIGPNAANIIIASAKAEGPAALQPDYFYVYDKKQKNYGDAIKDKLEPNPMFFYESVSYVKNKKGKKVKVVGRIYTAATALRTMQAKMSTPEAQSIGFAVGILSRAAKEGRVTLTEDTENPGKLMRAHNGLFGKKSNHDWRAAEYVPVAERPPPQVAVTPDGLKIG